MTEDPKAPVRSGPRKLRIWPGVLIVGAFWAFQFIVSQIDLTLFQSFMSNVGSSAAMLLLFLIFWLASGALPWRTRFAALGLFIATTVLGVFLAHRSFNAMGLIMASVPYALTGWLGWMFVSRRREGGLPLAALAGLFVMVFGFFDVVRWDGLDGRLHSSMSWRWGTTQEQAFLKGRSAPSAAAGPTRPWVEKPGDWTGFRGAQRDGVVRGIRIETNWKTAPPQTLWKIQVGPGWSSMIAVDGFLVTQEQRGDMESVVCYDAETGKEIWVHGDPTRFTEGISGAGPRATPAYHEGRIYTLGANGRISCLEATTGKPVWSRDLAVEGSRPVPVWGFSASPLLAEGRIIVFIGGTSALGTVALDASTGATAWSRLGGTESYSSAELLTIRGTPQVLIHDNKGLSSLSARDGAVLWQVPGPEGPVIPMLQPNLIADGRLLITSGAGLALLDLNKEGASWKVSQVWQSDRFRPSFSDFVVRDGYVYGLSDGTLACADLRTGERVWKKERFGSGQLLLLGDQGLLVILSEKGEIALAEARPQEPGELVRIPAIEGKTWNHLAFAQDRLFVRNSTEIACYRLRSLKTP